MNYTTIMSHRVVKFKWSAQRLKQNCFMYSTNFISTKLHYNFPSLLQTTHMYTNILHTHYLFWNYVIVKCRWFLVTYVKILIPSLVIYEDNVFHRKKWAYFIISFHEILAITSHGFTSLTTLLSTQTFL